MNGMCGVPPETALVLVGIMPSSRDMEIARLLGWYRIPMRFAPKVINVDYLAFYQPASFGEEHQWRIEAFAEVRGYELTTRGELFRDERSHPRAHEEYFKIQLGEVQFLPQVIQAKKWRRITFLYTTGELLRKAQTVEDLVVRSNERDVLWKAIKERIIQAKEYQPGNNPEPVLDEETLAFLGCFLPPFPNENEL